MNIRIVAFALIVAVTFVAVYLVAAFTAQSWDPTTWPPALRLMASAIPAWVTVKCFGEFVE